MNGDRHRARAHLRRVIRIALAAAVLWYLVAMIRVDELREALANAHGPTILAAVLLLVPNLALQFLKWRLIVRRHDARIGARDIAASLFIGFSFGIATPARLGEFGGRAYSIPGARPGALIGLTALDKYFSFLVTLTFGAAGLCAFLVMTRPAALATVAGIALAVALVDGLTVAALLHPGVFLRRLEPHRERRRFAARLCAMLETLAVFRGRDYLALLGLSMLFYATFVAQFCLLLAAFTPVDAGAAIAGVSAVMFVKSVVPPVTFGELGIREGAAVYFLSHLGVPAAAAFNASLLLFAINLLLPSLVGVLFFGRILPGRWRS